MRAISLASVLVSLLPLLAASTPPARAAEPPFHELWRQGRELGFDGWTLAGVRGEEGQLVLDLPGSPGSGGSGALAEGSSRVARSGSGPPSGRSVRRPRPSAI